MAFGDIDLLTGGTSTGVTTVDISLPAGIALDDLLVLVATNGVPQVFGTITLSPSGTVTPAWTVITNASHSALGNACWVKPASSYDVTNAGGGNAYRLSGSASAAIAWVIMVVKGAANSTRRTSYVEQSTATNTSIAPTALTGVLPADVTLQIYQFGEQTRNLSPVGDAIVDYPASAPTWTQRAQAKTLLATNSGLWDSAIAVISKLGGGLTGDLPSAGSGSARTGTFAVNSISMVAPPPTDKFMPFFAPLG